MYYCVQLCVWEGGKYLASPLFELKEYTEGCKSKNPVNHQISLKFHSAIQGKNGVVGETKGNYIYK